MGLDMYLIKRKKGSRKNYWDFDQEEVYWRKANMIHKYFCDNCKEIEAEVIYKVAKRELEDLLNKCNKVLEIVKTKQGKVVNGQIWNEATMKWEDCLEDGLEIINQSEVAEILPTESGFFFGSTAYDGYYLKDIEFTAKKIKKLLDTINFDEYNIYYLASW